MNELLAFDPSVQRAGLALFRGGELIQVTQMSFVPTFDGESEGARVVRCAMEVIYWLAAQKAAPSRLAVEWPQIYRTAKSKGDPNKLLPLAGLCGALAGMLRAIQDGREETLQILSYKPSEWAGQVPKATKARKTMKSPRALRIQSRLNPRELRLWEGLGHDAIDAIGIGLYALGRFERRRSWE